MDDNAELISYNTSTFKSEAQMLLHISIGKMRLKNFSKFLKVKGVKDFVIQEFGIKRVHLKLLFCMNMKIQNLK